MAEATTTTTTISRRPTRLVAKDQESVGTVFAGIAYEPRSSSSSDEDTEESPRETSAARSSPEPREIPDVDLGIDLSGIFPTTPEGIGKQVATCLQAANASNQPKVDGRPLNFGIVLPGTIYRSSFPKPDNLPFFGSLGLKTVLSLVKNDLPVEFKNFMASNAIRHYIVEMQGTKRVEIPDTVMNSIMEIALNKENYPLLIHCNHGKHRTGCAAAVIRHVSGWSVDQIIQEYKGFAEPKVRACDVKYIREYKVVKLAGFFHEKLSPSRSAVLTSAKMRQLLVVSGAAIAVWITTGVLWGEGYL